MRAVTGESGDFKGATVIEAPRDRSSNHGDGNEHSPVIEYTKTELVTRWRFQMPVPDLDEGLRFGKRQRHQCQPHAAPPGPVWAASESKCRTATVACCGTTPLPRARI